MAFSGNYEIVAISTDKTTIFNDLDYKADIGQHFHKSEKSARWRHRHKIIKTNLKTHVGIYSSIFSEYDLKHKKRQNNALIT